MEEDINGIKTELPVEPLQHFRLMILPEAGAIQLL
jgi:hypothetical protein